MRRLILILVVLVTLAGPSVVAQQRRGRARTLTLAAAQRVLNQQIDTGTADNVLFTCRACYNPDDRAENDNFPIVTSYGSISQFLVRKGYVRRRGGEEFFTAKAKRSPYFEAFGDGRGGFGGAGFRFANFKNPKITVTKITDPKDVPIEYDVVPTAVTQEFFGGTKRVRSKASFSYEDGRWNVCINCGN